jgi:hypothetical protein
MSAPVDFEQLAVELKPNPLKQETSPDLEALLDQKVSVTMNVRRRDLEKLQAFMHGDEWERGQAIRTEKHEDCLESLTWCVDIALHADYSTAVSIAVFLASLYNGHRVKADVSRIFNYDDKHFSHLMNVLHLCHDTHREPHSFFKEGNAIFEEIITRHGLEKRRRKS